jgi:hypothetical protein
VEAAGRAYLQAANKAVVHREHGDLDSTGVTCGTLTASAAGGAD